MAANVDRVITARPRDIGSFSVRRYLPHARRRLVGPFIFFDHMGPVDFEVCDDTQDLRFVNWLTGRSVGTRAGSEGTLLDAAELDRINGEIRKLNEAESDAPDPPMLWFARFIWSLPR